MKDDLVKLLRNLVDWQKRLRGEANHNPALEKVFGSAADRIESLEGEKESLRDAGKSLSDAVYQMLDEVNDGDGFTDKTAMEVGLASATMVGVLARVSVCQAEVSSRGDSSDGLRPTSPSLSGEALEAEVARLREALEPFSEIHKRLSGSGLDENQHILEAPANDIAPGAVYTLQWAAFCEAAAALSHPTKPEDA